MTIVTQVKIEEADDFQFRARFIFDGRELTTWLIDRRATKAEVLDAMRAVVADYRVRRSKGSFDRIKQELEVAELDI